MPCFKGNLGACPLTVVPRVGHDLPNDLPDRLTRRSHSRSPKVSKAATGGARRDTEGGFDPMTGAGPRRSSEPAASGT
jgi:hypothetical protein